MKQVQCFGPTFLDLHVNIAAFWRIWLGAYKNDTLCKGGGGMISGSLSTRYGASLGCGWRNRHQYGELLRIYLKKNQGQSKSFGPPAWGSGQVLTTPHLKYWPCYETYTCVLGPGLIRWYDITHGKVTCDPVYGRLGACIGQVHLRQTELAKYKLDLEGL